MLSKSSKTGKLSHALFSLGLIAHKDKPERLRKFANHLLENSDYISNRRLAEKGIFYDI